MPLVRWGWTEGCNLSADASTLAACICVCVWVVCGADLHKNRPINVENVAWTVRRAEIGKSGAVMRSDAADGGSAFCICN